MKSVRINGEAVWSWSCYESEKTHLLLEQNTKEIKEDFSIVKLNICNLHKAVIMRLKYTETLKNRSFI